MLARVLVVDDERNARDALGEILRDSGFEVATAASGPEGLTLVDSFRPDVLLTDVRMPGMSGIELAKAARREPRSLGVIYMSAYPRSGTDSQARWLAKPLDVDALVTTVRELTGSEAETPTPLKESPWART
jgi:CheY-like chemotaxis protein